MSSESIGEKTMDAIEIRFTNICSVLQEVKETLKELKRDSEEGKQWRSRTEEVIDSMIERINSVTDSADRTHALVKENFHDLNSRVVEHQSFIDQFTGGKKAVFQFASSIATLVGTIAVLFKLFLGK